MTADRTWPTEYGSKLPIVTGDSIKRESYYRQQSFWLDTVPESLEPRASLHSGTRADVVIIGAGYTGLWTAYYLNRHAPDLDIAIVEAEIAGFGASGRNGGWCTSYVSGLEHQMGQTGTREQAIALQRMMFDTVVEVGRACEAESIDCHFAHEGHVEAAQLPAQLDRNHHHVKYMHEKGFVNDFQWLSAEEVQNRVNIDGALGGFFMPHCAAIQPALLARGLARVLEQRGVRIYEQTPANSFDKEGVKTTNGSVKADTVLLASEGYSGSLPGLARKLVPFHSTMVATEALTDEEIAATGLDGRFTWNNGRHMVTYGQLTADRRIAFGHRGKYLYNGRIQGDFDREDPVFNMIHEELFRLFPSLRGKRFTHSWGGAMGVSRTMTPAVCFDRKSGQGWAGGFFGDGVGATNLAGRTMADLVLGRDTERSHALWVNPEKEKALTARLWEPEPIRWLGVQARAQLMTWTDRAETRRSRIAGPLNWLQENLFP
jgi:glycine/D-amino acid oxidase-like deaminating enzyme